MLNILDQKFMDWVGKNKVTFLLVALLAGNVYQYIEGRNRDETHTQAIEVLNEKIRTLNEKALEYEKERTLRMEFLLNNLPKTTSSNENSSKNTSPK